MGASLAILTASSSLLKRWMREEAGAPAFCQFRWQLFDRRITVLVAFWPTVTDQRS